MTASAVPFVFSPNTLIQSAQVNADFTSVVGSLNNIDAAQITTGVLPVAHGGTGSSTTAGALTSLNALPLTGGTLTGNLTAPGLTSTGNFAAAGSVTAASGFFTTGTIGGNLTVADTVTAHGLSSTLDITAAGSVTAALGHFTNGTIDSNLTVGDTVTAHGFHSTLNILADGNVTAVAFIVSSDAEGKADIETPQPGLLDIVWAISPRTYRLPGAPDPQTKHWGFVAQEVGKAMIDAGREFGGVVVDKESGRLGLAYHGLVAVLWGAVQELTARVKALEAANGAS